MDLEEGDRYVEPVREDLEYLDLEIFYKIIVWREEYINPMTDGKFSWNSINSCSFDSDEVLEN